MSFFFGSLPKGLETTINYHLKDVSYNWEKEKTKNKKTTTHMNICDKM